MAELGDLLKAVKELDRVVVKNLDFHGFWDSADVGIKTMVESII